MRPEGRRGSTWWTLTPPARASRSNRGRCAADRGGRRRAGAGRRGSARRGGRRGAPRPRCEPRGPRHRCPRDACVGRVVGAGLSGSRRGGSRPPGRRGRARHAGWGRPSGTTLAACAERLAGVDLGAVVVTAIDRDGMLRGPDLVGLPGARVDGASRGGVGRRSVARGSRGPRRARGHGPRARDLAGAIVGHGTGRGCDDRRGGDRRVRAVRVIPVSTSTRAGW